MSNLDANQVLKTSFNDSLQSLSVHTVNSLIPSAYDYVSVNYATSTQEIYTFKSGGSGGALVATITINYTDSTKANISNVTRT